MNFKEQVKKDLKVFHNLQEFAEEMEIRYGGETYTIPVVLDHEGAQDRKKPSNDYVDGIFRVDAKIYMSQNDFDVIPRQGANIEVGDDIFSIAKVAVELGEIILELERLDE